MLPIVWSQTAKRNYAAIIESLSERSLDAAIKLDDTAEKIFRQISNYPLSFPITDIKKGCRRFVIAKHYSAVYEVRDRFVYIVSFFDNRRVGA